MLEILFIIAFQLTAVWVYFDATQYKIGKIPDTKGFFNLSAGAWAIATLLLWIVAFPAYVIKRKKLLEIAKNDPVEVGYRGLKLFILLLIPIVFFFQYAYTQYIEKNTNQGNYNCDDSHVINVAGGIIEDMPVVKEAKAKFVTIKEIVEQGYNAEKQIRACYGILVTTAGENELQYSIYSSTDKGPYLEVIIK